MSGEKDIEGFYNAADIKVPQHLTRLCQSTMRVFNEQELSVSCYCVQGHMQPQLVLWFPWQSFCFCDFRGKKYI